MSCSRVQWRRDTPSLRVAPCCLGAPPVLMKILSSSSCPMVSAALMASLKPVMIALQRRGGSCCARSSRGFLLMHKRDIPRKHMSGRCNMHAGCAAPQNITSGASKWSMTNSALKMQIPATMLVCSQSTFQV